MRLALEKAFAVLQAIHGYRGWIIIIIFLAALPSYGGDVPQKYNNIQNKIKKQRKKLETVNALETSFLDQIDKVNKKLDGIAKQLRLQRSKINETKDEIKIVKKDIETFKNMLDEQRGYLRRKLSSMQRYGNDAAKVFTVVLSSKDFSQVMRTMKYLKKVADYDYRRIRIYKDNLRELDAKKEKLNSLYVRLKADEKELKNKEEELKAEKVHKEVLLASVRRKQDGYRRMLKELTAASNKLRAILKRKPADTHGRSRFAYLKGKLSWPIGGKVAIPYGTYRDPQFKTPVFRRGIYIKAENGTSAKSIYTGKVVYADWFKGYGKVIIINHGSGYHSVYANLSEIFFNRGDIIKRKEAIGRVGDSGTLNAPALYFEIRYKGKPLNPLQWLGKRS